MTNIKQLEKDLGYSFSNVALLEQALTHRSCGKNNNERLEFVGDGILDHVIALNLYNMYPNLSEGKLSKIRAALVDQHTLVTIANELNLGLYLSLGEGEEKNGGRARKSILADALEAIFAAISFDSNFSKVKNIIERLYVRRLENAEILINRDSKSLLQEYLQSIRAKTPKYNLVNITGPDHNSIFHIECAVPELDIKVHATGKSKKEASQIAAESVLKRIKHKKKNHLKD